MGIRMQKVTWLFAVLLAFAPGCATKAEVKEAPAAESTARERAELRREVDRLLAGDGTDAAAPQGGAQADSELLVRL